MMTRLLIAFVLAAFQSITGTFTGSITGTPAGTVSGTLSGTFTPNPPQNFYTLCNGAGVVMCEAFDSAASIPDNEDVAGPTNSRGIASFTTAPVIDTTIAASGPGSLKFTIPANSSPGASGYWYGNLSPSFQVSFGAGSEFYVQWRQMFDMPFISTNYHGNGWKLFQMFTGDTATHHYAGCVNNEIVLQNTNYSEFVQGYNACEGHASYQSFQDLWTNNAGSVVNTTPQNTQNNNRQQTVTPFCRSDSAPTYQNCVKFFPNEWMTFQTHIKLGPLVNNEWQNSLVQVYVARQGQPGVLAINVTMNLDASSVTAEQNLGKITFLPYDTGRSGTYVQTYTWYDDLIVSTQPIPMVY